MTKKTFTTFALGLIKLVCFSLATFMRRQSIAGLLLSTAKIRLARKNSVSDEGTIGSVTVRLIHVHTPEYKTINNKTFSGTITLAYFAPSLDEKESIRTLTIFFVTDGGVK
jgi:hypothetical protein